MSKAPELDTTRRSTSVGGDKTTTTPPPTLPGVTGVTGSYYPLPPIPGAPPIARKDITVSIVAERIIDFCYEHGDVITNLRLQKLLYYAQAWHLAIYGKPMFSEDFEAWQNGPVQPFVFAKYRHFGSRPIDRPPSAVKLPEQEEEHIKDLFQSYGRLSGFEIEQLTREEEPWREARLGLSDEEPSSRIVATKTMKRYYKARLNG